MASTFGGINTALTSLYAQRRGLDVSGQNIANANTEGYSRQRVRMQAQAGSMNPGIYSTTDQVGSGVSVAGVERGRNEYLEERGRTEHANSAYLATQKATFTSIEDVFAEPSDTALQARMHDMWDAWNDVANNWQDSATRSTLLERSRTVALSLNEAHGSLSNQFDAQHNTMDTYANQVNTLGGSIADLNRRIVVAQQSGMPSNELQDQRDRDIMQLSELSGATTSHQPNGAVNVFIGNSPLVSEFGARKLRLAGSPTLDGVLPPPGSGATPVPVSLEWTDTGAAATPGGTMGAMLDAMNTIIPDIVDQLNSVATALITKVNAIHAGDGTPAHPGGFTADGTPGGLFFDGTSAKDIAVVIDDVSQVAFSKGNPAATPPAVAALDHDIADELADVGTSGTGPDQAYQAMVGQLGVSAQAALRRSDIQDSVTGQVDSDRAGEAGVNLDEEMTHLLTYQRGYEAASRVLTTIDSMLDQLINRTGLVGR